MAMGSRLLRVRPRQRSLFLAFRPQLKMKVARVGSSRSLSAITTFRRFRAPTMHWVPGTECETNWVEANNLHSQSPSLDPLGI